MSIFLIKALERHPLLYYAIEEALECAQSGYYGIGIITFSQLVNLFGKDTPESRHIVAHEVLKQRPSKEMFETIVESFKATACQYSDREVAKSQSIEEYNQKISEDWNALIKSLHDVEINIQQLAAPDREETSRPES